MKKANAILEIAILLLLVFSVNAFALNNTSAVLRIESKSVLVGDTFDINVSIKNNPGIIAANINVSFDEELVLVDAVNGEAFSPLTYIPPRQLKNSTGIYSTGNFAWQGFDIDDKDIKDGTILTLRFKLSSNAKAGETYNVFITNKTNDVVDKDLNSIELYAQGKIKVVSHSLIKIESKAATCTKNGNITYYKCSSCKSIFSDSKGKNMLSPSRIVIKAKGHTYGNWKTIKSASQNEDGKKERVCSVCQNKSTSVIKKISTISLSNKKYTYDGKTKKPKIIVKDSDNKELKLNVDYSVLYSSGRKNPGRYSAKITFKGKYSGSKVLYFTVLPGVTSNIATTPTSTSVKLTWDAVPKATGYKIYRYDEKTKKYTVIKTVTGTTYTVSKLKSKTKYKFAVKAYSVVNEKLYIASKSKTVSVITAFPAPTLKVKAGTGKAVLSWKKQNAVEGYVIYMSSYETGKYKKIAALKYNKLTYTKSGLTKGKAYSFKIKSYVVSNGKTLYSDYSTAKNVKIK